ncbi:MAG: acetyl-coenzyme A carboxylase carboxyl transferase subunit beta [Candidatus Hydrogenedentota bacterium]
MAFLKRRRFVSVIGRRSQVPDGMWLKCPGCGQAITSKELHDNLMVCTHCDYHHRVSARDRIEFLLDHDTFVETHAKVHNGDPLGFVVEEVKYSYPSKVKAAEDKSGLREAIVTGFGAIEGYRLALGVMDFGFLGGSMGSATGEKFCRLAEDAIEEKVPMITFSSSGGARMMEGILSLMQMAKTSEAVRRMNEAGIPYVSVLTHPTTGGVFASFSTIGDIILAEPHAHIGFAGPRLIERSLKVKLPEGFQTAEYQYGNGFIDRIVKRTEMRSTLGKLVRYLSPSR